MPSWRSPTSMARSSAARASMPQPSPASSSINDGGGRSMSVVLIQYVVPVIHVLACLFLIVVVLLQTGKGADMGAVFGGGSQTLFGSGGAGNCLTKLTTGTAVAFMITSLILSYGQNRAPSSTLLDRIPDQSAPAGVPNADKRQPR